MTTHCELDPALISSDSSNFAVPPNPPDRAVESHRTACTDDHRKDAAAVNPANEVHDESQVRDEAV